MSSDDFLAPPAVCCSRRCSEPDRQHPIDNHSGAGSTARWEGRGVRELKLLFAHCAVLSFVASASCHFAIRSLLAACTARHAEQPTARRDLQQMQPLCAVLPWLWNGRCRFPVRSEGFVAGRPENLGGGVSPPETFAGARGLGPIRLVCLSEKEARIVLVEASLISTRPLEYTVPIVSRAQCAERKGWRLGEKTYGFYLTYVRFQFLSGLTFMCMVGKPRPTTTASRCVNSCLHFISPLVNLSRGWTALLGKTGRIPFWWPSERFKPVPPPATALRTLT